MGITKCGSSTLRIYVAAVTEQQNQTYNADRWKLDEAIGALRVAFVRDPVDRFVSSYMEIYIRGYVPLHDDIQMDFDRFFEQYLGGNYSDGRYTIKPHFRAQTLFLCHANGDGISLDYIGRTEHIDDEWNTTFRAFLPPTARMPDLPRKRGRYTNPKISKPKVRPDQVRHICRMYCHDYCCLGMDFPPECRGGNQNNATAESDDGQEHDDIGRCPCQSKKLPVYPWHTSS